MATLKQRLHKMNSSGSYDTVHLETESSLVLRPSGRTVEQDLTDYLPEVQDSDTVPESLKSGKLVVGSTTAWLLGTNILKGGDSIPSGIITMWSGASSAIPDGWLLCDGNNNTPDLRDRFIVGAGNSYTVGATGGEATHKLTTSEMPSHNHTFSGSSHTHTLSLSGLRTSTDGAHTHSISNAGRSSEIHYSSGGASVSISKSSSSTTGSAGGHSHTISGSGSIGSATAGGSIGSTGSGSAHENRPPYYALCFIMKQ